MSNILSIFSGKDSRIFVISNIEGDYYKLIPMLFEQQFSNKDILITVGNFMNFEKEASLLCMEFIKNNTNVYSVMGYNEHKLLAYLREEKYEDLPVWIKQYPDISDLVFFLETLPPVIEINDSMYVVHAGLEPYKKIGDQDPEVFYTIGCYDEDSRFYLFPNPEQKDWYDFEFEKKIIFGNHCTENISCPAGYSIGRDEDNLFKCLLFDRTSDTPIIIEA